MGSPYNAWLSAMWQTDKATARTIVEDALRSERGNVAKTAKRLGIGKRTLFRWIGRYGLGKGAPCPSE
jgi:transcriptional regulator with PAS, ATPase and Fis domain